MRSGGLFDLSKIEDQIKEYEEKITEEGFWNDQESLKKGIAFYEKALTLVDIQDNSAIKHIDTVTVKPGKEAELKQLIQEMDAAGLLTQKYK